MQLNSQNQRPDASGFHFKLNLASIRLRLAIVLLLMLLGEFLIGLAPAQAQTTTPLSGDKPALSPSLRFRHLTTNNGLPGNHVEAFVQDKRGFMWIGTWEGLARYDGYRFVTYKQNLDDSNSLSDDIIMALIEDREGMIWVGTRDGGLTRFNPNTEQFTRYPLNGVAMVLDPAGNLWVGSGDGKISRFNSSTDSFQSYSLSGCNRPRCG